MTRVSLKKVHSEEQKKKWSEMRKGKKLTEEHKRKIGEAGKGKILSKQARKNISNGKLAEKNPMWKGSDAGYSALHLWVTARLKKPEKCDMCEKKIPYDLANKSGKYLRDLNDWQWLCRSCHMKSDGRIMNLKIGKVKRGEVGSCEM